jgi:hypothetical protein
MAAKTGKWNSGWTREIRRDKEITHSVLKMMNICGRKIRFSKILDAKYHPTHRPTSQRSGEQRDHLELREVRSWLMGYSVLWFYRGIH